MSKEQVYEYKLLIPKERVGVLVGEKGKTKRLIERLTGTKLKIDEEEVTIKGVDSFNAWACQNVIKAIGRGFNPKDAIKLVKEGFVLEVIDVMDYARNQKDKYRLRGRVIGEDGKTRRHLENATQTKIIVFGKTIGIIGKENDVRDALEAVKIILQGSHIKTAYKFLEKKAKSRLKKELI